MKFYDTPIGKVGTLGPGEIRHLEHLDASLDALQPGKYGWEPDDEVPGDEECPHTGATGHLRWPLYCGVCNDSGTISVPYVVRDVLPIATFGMFSKGFGPYISVDTSMDGKRVVDLWDGERWHHDVDLPDAQPGGVALLVERAR